MRIIEAAPPRSPTAAGVSSPSFAVPFFPMAFPLDVVVLAAGQGKRMHSGLPKVLHRLAGRPLAAYVLATVRSLSPRAIAVVTGFGAEAVEHELGSLDVIFVRQEPPRGTGDAARVALSVRPRPHHSRRRRPRAGNRRGARRHVRTAGSPRDQHRVHRRTDAAAEAVA